MFNVFIEEQRDKGVDLTHSNRKMTCQIYNVFENLVKIGRVPLASVPVNFRWCCSEAYWYRLSALLSSFTTRIRDAECAAYYKVNYEDN